MIPRLASRMPGVPQDPPLMFRLLVATVGPVPDKVTHIYQAYEDAGDAEVLGFLKT
jgi:hypothetical protein